MMLHTSRLILRPWEERDAEQLYKLASDPEVGPDCGWNPHKSLEESRELLPKLLMNVYTWAIVLKETDEVIGNISLMPFGTSSNAKNEKQKEIGFWLGRAYWGNGYMPEACKELLRHAFEDLGAECVWCAHHDKNHKSARVQEKCGFHFDHKKDNVYLRQLDCCRNSIVNCLTKEQWEQMK